MSDCISPLLAQIRAQSPLVHAITNPISIHACANAILAVGARPIMAEHPEEVADITRTASALVLNLGNITDVRIASMQRSARTAAQHHIPIVLDAVGVGCSPLRRRLALDLMQRYPMAIIKGNYGEIQALGCPDYAASGVDGDSSLSPQMVVQTASRLSQATGAVLLASGKADLVVHNRHLTIISNGTAQLSRITGTGCMLGALCGALLCAAAPAQAAWIACVLLGVAGERADSGTGTGTFACQLMDQLSTLDGPTLHQYKNMEEYDLEQLGHHTIFGH